MDLPQKGDKIYIPSSLYISHGRDDIKGGLAEITEININRDLGENHFNYCFVGLKGFPKSIKWNYKSLIDQQSELKKEFGDKYAAPDPDLHPSSNPPNYGW